MISRYSGNFLSQLFSSLPPIPITLLENVCWHDSLSLPLVLETYPKLKVALREETNFGENVFGASVSYPQILEICFQVLHLLERFWKRIVNAQQVVILLLHALMVSESNEGPMPDQIQLQRTQVISLVVDRIQQENLEHVFYFLTDLIFFLSFLCFMKLWIRLWIRCLDVCMERKMDLKESVYFETFRSDFWHAIKSKETWRKFYLKWKKRNWQFYLTSEILQKILHQIFSPFPLSRTKSQTISALVHLQWIKNKLEKPQDPPLFSKEPCKFWKIGCKSFLPDCILGFGIWSGDSPQDIPKFVNFMSPYEYIWHRSLEMSKTPVRIHLAQKFGNE